MRVSLAALLLLLALPLDAGAAPSCGPANDGWVAEGGCRCGYDRGGQLTGRSPGWRWSCDLLRGPGPVAQVDPAGPPAQTLPPGFNYAPMPSMQGSRGGMEY